MREIQGHAGDTAVAVARAHGIETMFTLSGGHVFPLYDGAVKDGMRLVDVRHEQTAVFAAEATAKLTRRPGLAVLTAGPGVTNGVSAVATAHFNGSPLVVIGGRAPASRWGSGALQELDHPPLLAPVTKLAFTAGDAASVADDVDLAFRTASAPHRGPVFLDVYMDHLFSPATATVAPPSPVEAREPDAEALAGIAALLAEAERPVLVLGSDVWMDGAAEAARACAEELRLPVIANGQGRGILPAGHELLATRARSRAFGQADLVIVAGTPLDFRLGYGLFGGRDGAPLARVVHLADASSQLATHMQTAGSASGDLSLVFAGLADAAGKAGVSPKRYAPWVASLAEAARAAVAGDAELLASDADPIHPMRIYGELNPLLADDAIVIGDGGDFVSYAGKYIEPRRPGGWLDPGPYGCLGTGLGYAIAARLARPSSQVVLLLGDGAAGFSLMDVDTLVRHKLPVVMICGNNGAWGLEKHPMQMLYGYDVAADLQPECRYDQVVKALGGDGELVRKPSEIAPALQRAFASEVPYLVNIATDPQIAYPRNTTGV
ncbi:acetolactate synthase [Bailinhaonella thermotolerans]|uniref:Acetolactate synthase n=1 Tax=Bailinhaonella thermotolerans TaxID=1070861 RepID=A0A3A4AEK7_9ACTN|nr:acetolactate synthase [Bailinhaonella thermotolerans]RJL25177.1 acetolactate synthase [Bailinhaonella thermotolerans]